MGHVSKKENIHVRVEPRERGDFGFARVGGMEASEEEKIAQCEEIAASIRRHVDDLPSYGGRGVSVDWEVALYCEHCGCDWTEGADALHNGGCCEEDCKVMEQIEEQQS